MTNFNLTPEDFHATVSPNEMPECAKWVVAGAFSTVDALQNLEISHLQRTKSGLASGELTPQQGQDGTMQTQGWYARHAVQWHN